MSIAKNLKKSRQDLGNHKKIRSDDLDFDSKLWSTGLRRKLFNGGLGDYFPALIKTTISANAMRQFRLMTLGTSTETRGRQFPIGASQSGTRPGGSIFGICHRIHLLLDLTEP